MDKKITCRPCKEKNNWEIENEFGVVLEKHYKTKDACVKAGQKLADECHCELCVCDTTSCSNEYFKLLATKFKLCYNIKALLLICGRGGTGRRARFRL